MKFKIIICVMSLICTFCFCNNFTKIIRTENNDLIIQTKNGVYEYKQLNNQIEVVKNGTNIGTLPIEKISNDHILTCAGAVLGGAGIAAGITSNIVGVNGFALAGSWIGGMAPVAGGTAGIVAGTVTGVAATAGTLVAAPALVGLAALGAGVYAA